VDPQRYSPGASEQTMSASEQVLSREGG